MEAKAAEHSASSHGALSMNPRRTETHPRAGLLSRTQQGEEIRRPRGDKVLTAITVAPQGRVWAVKHTGGVLGYARSRSQGIIVGEHLVDWLKSQGRASTLELEEPAFAAPLRTLKGQFGEVLTPVEPRREEGQTWPRRLG